jgi:prephenate dehydrogenase (NADP+)
LYRILVCDRPERFEAIRHEWRGAVRINRRILHNSYKRARFLGVSGVTVVQDGHRVSRAADFIIYSVEAEFIGPVVAQYGPCTSYN